LADIQVNGPLVEPAEALDAVFLPLAALDLVETLPAPEDVNCYVASALPLAKEEEVPQELDDGLDIGPILMQCRLNTR
jgi:hypothetical protein